MFTKIAIRNFKRFDDVSIDLDSPVVFIGPNNRGKTSAMQALTLWSIGVRRWQEKRAGKSAPEKRPGVTVGRRDLVAIPSPSALSLWRDLHVRDMTKESGRMVTKNIRIEIMVEGETGTKKWACGLEFDYANEESFYCRPLRLGEDKDSDRMPVSEEMGETPVVFLPPMSGLAATEARLDPGAIDVKIGEGRTAEVLRNLCYRLSERSREEWKLLTERIKGLFGVRLEAPRYVRERGEITMSYKEHESKKKLDLSSSGRGLQQTLLLLSFMRLNSGAVLLLDEPDAHLEILRQRQTYRMIAEEARINSNQLIVASHSEVLLGEAAARKDRVVAFVGKPHTLDVREKGEVRKALAELGFDQYYLAEQEGWVLYLEGSTDLSILQAFATRCEDKKAKEILASPFVHYVEDSPQEAWRHYDGLRAAWSNLVGVALFDKRKHKNQTKGKLKVLYWEKREAENYLCTRGALMRFARSRLGEADLLELSMDEKEKAMQESIEKIEKGLSPRSPWGPDVKASDEVLVPVFKKFFGKIGEYNTMGKKNLHDLVPFLSDDEIDPEIREKLEAIKAVEQKARPRQ